MDAAFFQADVLRLLAARGCGYAIKVGYWSWLPLKQLAAARRHWHALAPDVTGFDTCPCRLTYLRIGVRLGFALGEHMLDAPIGYDPEQRSQDIDCLGNPRKPGR